MGAEKFEAVNKYLSDNLLQSLVNIVIKSKTTSSSLLKGRAGELLFLYEAAKYKNLGIDSNWLSNEINTLIANANTVLPDYSMAYGIAGIAWFYQYILQDQQESDDENSVVDSLFSEILSTKRWQGEYEYIFGLAGFAPYLARRTHTLKGKSNALSLVEHFAKLAIINNRLAYWPTPVESFFRVNKTQSAKIEVNLGLAHGNAGVLAALLVLSKAPSVADSARFLLTAGCDWLIQQQQNPESCNSYFSCLSGRQEKSRLGWCYGDLTIALTLARAGKLLNQNGYTALARTLALHAASRDAASAEVYDNGVCHGSSGLALVFRLLYKELQSPELLEASMRWQSFYLRQYQKKGEVALYKWVGDIVPGDHRKREEQIGLLEGFAGIGLSLLAGLNQNDDWVDALLLA